MYRIFIAISTFLFSQMLSSANYVGAVACQQCHSEQTELWQQSHHAKSMQPATSQHVLAPFAGEAFKQDNTFAKFTQRDGQYWVTTNNAQGELEEFQVINTFGFYPLQQYLLATTKGRQQAFDIAWDSRPNAQGGQRWYHLQPVENPQPGHPFFWQGAYQNWNSRCASCHSTNLQVGFNDADLSYKTTYSDINVACESCHGPASEHIARANGNDWSKGSGLLQINPPTQFVYQEGQAIAKPQGISDASEIDVCGGCHSRRGVIGEIQVGKSYHDTYQLQGLETSLYFANGQIKDEVFVLGSFLQSKMYQQGVRCSNCHDPHSGKTVLQGDALCAQCHNPATYAQTSHSKHQPEQAQCVDCHMSNRLYMGVDWRRDHGFHLPTSALADDPNACQACHDDKTMVAQALQDWPSKKSHWSTDLQRARSGDARAVRYLSQWLQSETTPDMVKASMLQQLAANPSRMSVQLAQQHLTAADPMLRATAIEQLQVLPPEQRWPLLQPLLGDDSQRVKLALARVSADLLPMLEGSDQRTVARLQEVYRASLMQNLDMPGAQLGLAELAMRAGDLATAQQRFEKALAVDPAFVSGMLNYADFKRQLGDENAAKALLESALHIAPDSADVNFSLGLSYVRQKQYAAALPYLQTAASLETAIPHYAYVYAVALDNEGQLTAAIDTLQAANERWAYDYNLLSSVIQFMEKAGRGIESGVYVAKLSEIAPNAPEVRAYLQNYRQ